MRGTDFNFDFKVGSGCNTIELLIFVLKRKQVDKLKNIKERNGGKEKVDGNTNIFTSSKKKSRHAL